MKKSAGCLITLIFIPILLAFAGAFYTVEETEQVIITQFGEPVDKPILDAGLKFKIPFVQVVNRFEKRILEWDGEGVEMPTKDKTYILVDTFARWRIADSLQFFRRLRDTRSALSRLDDILGSETRNTIAKHELIEVIRTTGDRQPTQPEELTEADLTGNLGKLLPIRRGRSQLESDIVEKSREKLEEFGIELLDVRFKRVNYNQSVRVRIFDRMISERQQIASRFRSEGEGEAAKILGNMRKDLDEIESTAYKKVQQVKGEADARAIEIYAEAYNQSADAVAFYEFLRTMELYKTGFGNSSTLILSTDSDIFRFLKNVAPTVMSDDVPALARPVNPTVTPQLIPPLQPGQE